MEYIRVENYGLGNAREDIPRYGIDSNKYDHGTLVVVGGSREYTGAPFLSATSALYAEAGVVKVCIPEEAMPFCHIPQALIVHRLSCDSQAGVFSKDSICQFQRDMLKSRALVVGPGMGTAAVLHEFLKEAIATQVPKVLDADALNCIASNPSILPEGIAGKSCVLTPHEGEFARLAAAFCIDMAQSREERVLQLAEKLDCVVVLKGAGTLVASSNGCITRNTSGNNRLATAGTGDVLAGVIGALLAQGLAPERAARLGVFVHGLAADKLDAFIADDLAPCIAKLMHNGLY